MSTLETTQDHSHYSSDDDAGPPSADTLVGWDAPEDASSPPNEKNGRKNRKRPLAAPSTGSPRRRPRGVVDTPADSRDNATHPGRLSSPPLPPEAPRRGLQRRSTRLRVRPLAFWRGERFPTDGGQRLSSSGGAGEGGQDDEDSPLTELLTRKFQVNDTANGTVAVRDIRFEEIRYMSKYRNNGLLLLLLLLLLFSLANPLR